MQQPLLDFISHADLGDYKAELREKTAAELKEELSIYMEELKEQEPGSHYAKYNFLMAGLVRSELHGRGMER